MRSTLVTIQTASVQRHLALLATTIALLLARAHRLAPSDRLAKRLVRQALLAHLTVKAESAKWQAPSIVRRKVITATRTRAVVAARRTRYGFALNGKVAWVARARGLRYALFLARIDVVHGAFALESFRVALGIDRTLLTDRAHFVEADRRDAIAVVVVKRAVGADA